MVSETTKIVRVEFHKKKTDIFRRKRFELTPEETKIFRKKDPWKDGR